MNKKILILGASGLLGQTLVEFFKQKKYIIGALSRKSLSYADINITTYNIDILDYELLEQVIEKYDIIINCTGQITNPISQCLSLNTEGITNIINAVNMHNKKLVHISSVSVYGSAKYVNEENDLNPETPYAAIKYFADYLIKQRVKDHILLRVSNLYGQNQKKGIVNYLEKSYLSNNKNLYFNNDGSLKRYYLHAQDFSMVIDKVIKENIKGTYNIVGNEQFTIKELIAMFESILNFKFKVEYQKVPSIENIDTIECSKLYSKISFNCEINMKNYIKGLLK